MLDLEEKKIDCPYCGETISVLLDDQEEGEQYVEDCQVCCRPIVFRVFYDYVGNLNVSVHCEDDAI